MQLIVTYNQAGETLVHWLVKVEKNEMRSFEEEFIKYNQVRTDSAFYFNDDEVIEMLWYQGSYIFSQTEKLKEIIKEEEMMSVTRKVFKIK